jgi:hypothetical protein
LSLERQTEQEEQNRINSALRRCLPFEPV